jgi:hypothetical protein
MAVQSVRIRRILLITSLTFSSGVAHAQDRPSPEQPETAATAEAQQRFQRARQLYEEGDFALALVEFRRAYELAPNYRVLYNIGQVNIQLFNYAAARVALEKYLQDGGNDVPANRRTQVESDLKMLKERTAYIQIVTKPAGADVTVDDVPVGKAPFEEPLLVNAGQRKIGVSKVGFMPATRFITLGGGDRNDVSVELTAVPSNKPVIVTMPHESKPNYTPAVVGWIATGTLTVATAIVGGLYLSKQGEIDDFSKPSVYVTPQVARDTKTSATRLAVAADVLGLATVAAGLVSLYFTLRPPYTESLKPTTGWRLTPSGVAGTF